jgi:hypothetical protein
LYIINLIAEHLGANVFIRKNGARVDVNISSLAGCLFMIKFLYSYPLKSTKMNEFYVWREFVQTAYNISGYPSIDLNKNRPDFSQLIDKLHSVREDSSSS